MSRLSNILESLKSNWYVWLFPVFAILICVWLFNDYMEQRGPVVKIHFEDGSGIQAEKTSLRFRGVIIGMVKKVTIASDNKEVIAHVALQKDAEQFAVEGSKFWVVLPKVNFQGISGLETIFEGNYIAAIPGKSEAPTKLDFNGKIGSDVSDPLEDTVPYSLETDNADAVGLGDFVTFRGLKVGTVTKLGLSKTAQSVLVQIHVQNRYTKLIRTNTVFWRKVGVQAKLGLFNSELKISSLESLLRGGIDFSTPEPVGEVAKYQTKFALYAGPPKDFEKWNPRLEFKESGSPVR